MSLFDSKQSLNRCKYVNSRTEVTAMNNIAEYTFTIIEDGQVPLAGNFETYSFAPVIVVVALGLVLLGLIAYTLWIETRLSRISSLTGSFDIVNAKYFFHPGKLLRAVEELEYSLVSDSIK